MECLNCKKEVEQTVGKRPKLYCSDSCRTSFFQKKKKKGGISAKYVLKKTYDEMFERLNARIKQLEAQISGQGSSKVDVPKNEEKPKNEGKTINAEEIQRKIEELTKAANSCADTRLGKMSKASYLNQIKILQKQINNS